ncbi:MAG: DNA gyrase subunit A, partial [Gemmatimonadales bacterium]
SLQQERILPRFIEQEMRDSFIDYSMSVIVQRALPDARDGLKPVHRRILYAMHELGLRPDRPYKKSAAVVGDVLAKYHPHGDSAVYDTIVRMVQEFSLRYPLLDGQGNFGSIDGDSAAAYRYTEVRLAPIALELLSEIDLDTADWRPNFDGRLEEPTTLPARLPHLLLNGSDGIAVGMATKIPPHNLRELLAAADRLVEDPNCEVADLSEHVKGPDFPTGGYIWGSDGIRQAYETGRGLVDMRARLHVEEGGYGKSQLVVTELPYQVNKTRVIEQITKMVRQGRSDAISDLRDESDRDGVRLVIELKREADPRKVTEALFKKTQLRTTFGVIMLALQEGRPREMNLKEALGSFVDFRLDVIRRRAAFELKRSEDRAHLLQGLLVALDRIERVIEIIRGSRDPASASNKLRKELELSEPQAEAILAMRLSRLTTLEHKKLQAELDALGTKIEELRKLVEVESERKRHLRRELAELMALYTDGRRTEILEGGEFPLPSGGASGAALVIVSRLGYVKALAARTGAGLSGAEALEGRAGDFARRAFLCRGGDHLLSVTAAGSVHTLPVSALPLETRSSRGRALADFIDLEEGDRVIAVTPIDTWTERYLVTVTRRGQVKRTELSEYANARANGIIGTGLSKEDEVTAALVTNGSGELVLATRLGQAIRFAEEDVRPMGRSARGVRAIDLAPGDEVVAALAPRRDTSFCLATRRGHGKRLPLTELRLQSRAGKGVDILPDRAKVGELVGLVELHGSDRLVWELASGELVFSDGDRLKARARRAATLRVLRDMGMDGAVKAIHLAATGASDVEGEEPAAPGGEEVSVERPSGGAGVHSHVQLELAGDR